MRRYFFCEAKPKISLLLFAVICLLKQLMFCFYWRTNKRTMYGSAETVLKMNNFLNALQNWHLFPQRNVKWICRSWETSIEIKKVLFYSKLVGIRNCATTKANSVQLNKRSRQCCADTYLRHPDIGLVFKSCMVIPHSPIVASIHAMTSKLVIINSLQGTTMTVNIAVCEEYVTNREKLVNALIDYLH